MDDLSANQFNVLARVISLSSSARDFKHLLSPSNLHMAFAEPEDFVTPTVPRLHFEGSWNACAKERTQSTSYLHRGCG